MAEKESRQNQDGALAWLVVTTLAPHWRALLVAVLMLLATAALNVAPPYLVQQAIDGLIALLSSSAVLILSDTVTLIVIVITMLALNWRLALLALAVLPLLALVTRYFRRRIRGSSTSERTALARTSSFLSEQLNGMLLVQLFGRQRESASEFDHLNATYRETLIVLRRHSALFLAVQEVLAALGVAALLYGGGRGVLAGWATL